MHVFHIRIIVYAGKPEQGDGLFYIEGIETYIKTLVEKTGSKLLLQGRNISMGRLYTSISTANWLLEKNIIIVGTLMTNRRGIPEEIKIVTNREEFSQTIHFEEGKKDLALCLYHVKTKSKGKRNVLVLTTLHPMLGLTRDDRKKKPALHKFYDFSKGGTDIMDQKNYFCTCKAKSRKWKMAALYFILDTARANAQTMLCLKERNDVRKTKSFDIGFDLAMSLVVPEIRRRPKVGLNKTVLTKMAAILNDDEDESNNNNVKLVS